MGAVTPEAETRARRLHAEERPRRSRAAGQTASRGLGPQAEAGVPRGRPAGAPFRGSGQILPHPRRRREHRLSPCSSEGRALLT